MDLGEGPTTATLLKQLNSLLHSKYLSLYAQINVALIPHERNFCLQQTEAITENLNQSKYREQ